MSHHSFNKGATCLDSFISHLSNWPCSSGNSYFLGFACAVNTVFNPSSMHLSSSLRRAVNSSATNVYPFPYAIASIEGTLFLLQTYSSANCSAQSAVSITSVLQIDGSLMTSLTISIKSVHDLLHTILLTSRLLVPFSVSMNKGSGNLAANVDLPIPSQPMITHFIARLLIPDSMFSFIFRCFLSFRFLLLPLCRIRTPARWSLPEW